jgi:nucleotide-binding universal stress UspA family protein
MMEEKMKAIQKILVGCDFSKYSKNTVDYAATLADKFQAELIIVNVINKKDIDTILKVAEGQFDRNIEKYVEKTAQEYEARVKADRTRQMEKLIEEIGCAHLKIKKVFRVGVPFQELIGAVENERADKGEENHGNQTGKARSLSLGGIAVDPGIDCIYQPGDPAL